MRLAMKSIFTLVPEAKKSIVAREIQPEHVPYIADRPYKSIDRRTDGVYDFADVDGPDLPAMWSRSEKSYQGANRLEDFWAVTLNDVVVHPPLGVLTIGDVIVRETVRDSSVLMATFGGLDVADCRSVISGREPALEVPDFDVPTVLDEPCFQLGTGLAENYFNWSLRYLSKIFIYQRLRLRAEGRLRLLAPAPKQDFIAKSLEFFRVAQNDVRWLKGRTLMRQLVVSAPSAIGRYNLTPMLPEALRHHAAVRQLWRGQRQPIYVPRGSVRMRRVVNEAEVMERMRARGFLIFDAGAHALADQVRTFRDASMVVGPHGAALTNIVYCDRGTPVVEVVPEGYDQGPTSYRSLSDMFDLPYAHMVGRENPEGVRKNRCNSDFFISIPHLDSVIDRMWPTA